eukprot:TRINITY_DN7445_c0_g1_i1.p2 TRINITY_DN7445_c0_g1~~TRINITY_DN7445_c0_g1_i1.p2  ORF type:complete len:141 (-),score=22.81 TRINITY_DN7445_c0_g1_i1:505-927(-)
MNRLKIATFVTKLSSSSRLKAQKGGKRLFTTQPDHKSSKVPEVEKESLTKDARTVIKSEDDFIASLKQGLESKLSVWTLNAFNSILDYKIQNTADLGWLQKTHALPPVFVCLRHMRFFRENDRVADDAELAGILLPNLMK